MYRKIALFLCLILSLSLPFNPISLADEAPEAPIAPDREVVNQWCLDIINRPADSAPAGQPVKIAVIDSGIWTRNTYLQQEKILPGYNYVFQNNVTNDMLGHGSKTAAILTGGRSKTRELLGMGGNANIVPLVWISKYPSGVIANGGLSALCQAIVDAVNVYECKVINISSGIRKDEPELRKAVEYAEENGVIVISSVGNSNQYAPGEIYYPAAYETVIGVGSVNEDYRVSPFSQRNKSVMVTAPGEKVPTLAGGSKDFATVSGTSYSAAYVSGFASLMLSKKPGTSPGEFRRILMESSRDLGEKGYDTAYGYGIIDVSRGLSLVE